MKKIMENVGMQADPSGASRLTRCYERAAMIITVLFRFTFRMFPVLTVFLVLLFPFTSSHALTLPGGQWVKDNHINSKGYHRGTRVLYNVSFNRPLYIKTPAGRVKARDVYWYRTGRMARIRCTGRVRTPSGFFNVREIMWHRTGQMRAAIFAGYFRIVTPSGVLKASQASWYRNGRLNNIYNHPGVTVKTHRGTMTVKKVAWFISGKIKEVDLLKTARIRQRGISLVMVKTISFYQSGHMRFGSLKGTQTLVVPQGKIRAFHQIFFHSNGALKWVSIKGSSKVKTPSGYLHVKGLRFDRSGNMIQCTLAGTAVLGGRRYNKYDRIRWTSTGKRRYDPIRGK